MKMYSYIITRDFGFAPNPFGGYCTLATCKPSIRNSAQIDDWVIATGPKTGYNKSGYLFYAMKVEEKLTYNEYWEDKRFQYKKPIFNGSLKQCYGDNIYYLDPESKVWHQQDSHHSLEDGSINERNLRNDTKSPNVLISTTFYYFGNSNVQLPVELRDKVRQKTRIPLYKNVDVKYAKMLILWLEKNFEIGLLDEPIEFANGFKRFLK
jgi:hypothetical protein